MISRFFIDRPIFAAVLSIVITLAGGISVFTLPLAQFPPISPPTVSVQATYPGASAQDVAAAVAAPIEQQVNGVEGMMYMSSSCTNDGSYNLTVTFKHGVDLDMAQVLVQNRVSLATPSLPDVIKQTGVTTRKRSPDILMGIALNSPDGRYDQLYLSNYALMQIRDEIVRVEGVGDVFLFGQRDYSMRIWVDPDKLAARNLTASDVVRAIREQNAQVASGSVGQQPAENGQSLQITLDTLGRLTDAEQFENIILRTTYDGRILHLKDVARVELGAKNQDVGVRLDGKDTIFLAIFQTPDANALDTRDRVLAKMDELAASFPDGLVYEVGFDTTPYTRESINEVFKTLRDAVVLVAVVVLVFLQNWRSAIIPLVAVPVAIIGTFAVMAAMGFSLNNLTLFGLVLAIGIVVDDAIVVVEAVEHHIEHGLSPRDATIKAMEQVSGPVIAVGLVLSAVFVPCAFISGITGQFFRQFALTIAVSTLISAFNSLTLSPALTALLLRPRDKKTAPPLPLLVYALGGAGACAWYLSGWLAFWLHVAAGQVIPSFGGQFQPALFWVAVGVVAVLGGAAGWFAGIPLNFILGWAFRTFNAGFNAATNGYTRVVGMFLRVSVVVLVVYGGLLALTYAGFQITPKGFIPTQDKGYLLVNVQLPDSASAQRTQEVVERIENIAKSTPGVKHTVAVAGQSILLNANAPNFGALYVMLDDFDERDSPELSGDAIAARLQADLQDKIPNALINVFGAPPIDGLGTAGGFKGIVEDRGDSTLEELQTIADKTVDAGNDTRGLQDLFTSYRANTPWLYLEIDRTQAKMRGVPMSEIFSTLQVYLGSLYVNDFNRFGRTWQVNVQAGAEYRTRIENLQQIKMRNDQGKEVPLASLIKVREENGPVLIMRYNMYRSAGINGNASPGVSSGQAIELMENAARQDLPRSMRYEWTELALLQLQTGNTAMLVFLLAVVLVFLVLAAQYESTSLPLAVILVVPMCLLCSLAGVLLADLDVNIFTQVGFVVLIGLACKNAILIVEFAKARRESGTDRFQATLAACKLRLRPIVMTSFAFILGVIPLMIAKGAGAEMRRTLGTAVFAGMLGVTLFGIFLTPVFYYVIQWLSDVRTNEVDTLSETRLNGQV